METGKILAVLQKYNQKQILEHYRRITPGKKKALIKDISGLDLELTFRVHREFSRQKDSVRTHHDIKTASIIRIPQTRREKELQEEARNLGENLLRKNKVAVLIVAGGQGSRLGYDGPKGLFPISPVKQKPLFRMFAEKVKALANRYRAEIPLLIMTNRENRRTIEIFFKEHRFFRLNPEDLYFFEQEMLPSVTPEGNLILKDETHLFVNPNGHGGSLKALFRSGILKTLLERNVSELFYCQVDNPLVRVADPVFLGYHNMGNAEMSLKVLRRRDGFEKVGIYGTVNGKPSVVEYSDLPPEEMSAVDEEGRLKYWPGSIAIHIFSLTFIRRLNEKGFALPYHRAVKPLLPTYASSTREEENGGGDNQRCPVTAWKFETFVFDALPLAQRVCCVETIREEEFAPVKNRTGEDSPETTRRALSNQYKKWLRAAGVETAPEVLVEISPLYALDQEELVRKVRRKNLRISQDTYLG
ncbi:MAG: UTP--glucose-1-phosphate uridylyltransferase [Candidatus Omnitrophota bacterium]